MSIYVMTQIECDNCHDCVDLYMTKAAAKRDATANGWQMGRGSDRDLCEECKALVSSESSG
jgi:hypothetical protein